MRRARFTSATANRTVSACCVDTCCVDSCKTRGDAFESLDGQQVMIPAETVVTYFWRRTMGPTRLLIVLSLCAASSLVFAQPEGGAEVSYEEYHDTSGLAREYPSALPLGAAIRRVRPLYRRPALATTEQPDEAAQTSAAPAVAATIGLNFDGIADSANGSLAGEIIPAWP